MKRSPQIVFHWKTQHDVVVGVNGTLHTPFPSDNITLSINVMRIDPCKTSSAPVTTTQLRLIITITNLLLNQLLIGVVEENETKTTALFFRPKNSSVFNKLKWNKKLCWIKIWNENSYTYKFRSCWTQYQHWKQPL